MGRLLEGVVMGLLALWISAGIGVVWTWAGEPDPRSGPPGGQPPRAAARPGYTTLAVAGPGPKADAGPPGRAAARLAAALRRDPAPP